MQAKELIDYLNVQNPSKGCLAVAEPLILLESESLDTFHQRFGPSSIYSISSSYDPKKRAYTKVLFITSPKRVLFMTILLLALASCSCSCSCLAQLLSLRFTFSFFTFHRSLVSLFSAMPKHSHFSLFIALVFTPFISSCYGDLGTAARWNPPYIPNACGFDVSQYPSNNIFAAAGEGIWNNGAACGRQYAVQCRSADAPGSCINGQTIQVMIVDRALTLTSQPSREGILMVISGTGFQAIANASATNINIDYKPS